MHNKLIRKHQLGGGATLDPSKMFQNNSIFKLSTGLPNYSEQYAQNVAPSLKTALFKTGITLSNSDNFLTALEGQKLINEGTKIEMPQSSFFSTAPKVKKLDAGLVGSTISQMSDILSPFLEEKTEYEGQKGDLTKTLDSTYDNIANAAMAMGPYGQLVGGVMKGGSLISKGLNNLGGGTDGETSFDAIVGSNFLSLTPIGLVNGFGGKKTDSFTYDDETWALSLGSYDGSLSLANNAQSKANKKYGLFSSHLRERANNIVRNAKTQQYKVNSIVNEAEDYRSIAQTMNPTNSLGYNININGGYQLQYVQAAKHGAKFPSLLSKPEKDNKEIVETRRQLTVISDISDEATGRFTLRNSTAAIHGNLRRFLLLGGYNQKYALRAMNGAKIDINRVRKIVSSKRGASTISKFQQGGSLFDISNDVKNFYNGYDLSKINFFKSDSPRTEGNNLYVRDDEDAIHELYHYLSNNRPDINYSKWYEDLNNDKLLLMGADLQFVNRTGDPNDFYNPSELVARLLAAKFRTRGQNYTKEFFASLRRDENKYGDNMRDLLHMYNDENLVLLFNVKNVSLFNELRANSPVWQKLLSYINEEIEKHQKGGEIELINPSDILEGDVDEFKNGGTLNNISNIALIDPSQIDEPDEDVGEFRDGGAINIIPEGALHARKHNMDNAEHLTKKGIPVVDNEGNQQAEIENSEIIYRLEVTLELERLTKIFYNEDSSQADKDQAALEAGKLLVKETLHNTIDNTNNLL